jgi:hypothetical protein
MYKELMHDIPEAVDHDQFHGVDVEEGQDSKGDLLRSLLWKNGNANARRLRKLPKLQEWRCELPANGRWKVGSNPLNVHKNKKIKIKPFQRICRWVQYTCLSFTIRSTNRK